MCTLHQARMAPTLDFLRDIGYGPTLANFHTFIPLGRRSSEGNKEGNKEGRKGGGGRGITCHIATTDNPHTKQRATRPNKSCVQHTASIVSVGV